MFSVSVLSYTLLGLFGCFSIFKMATNKCNMLVTIMFNVLFGGTLYVVLNLFRVEMPFNYLSASCIAVLGVPGVILLVVLKVIFNVF